MATVVLATSDTELQSQIRRTLCASGYRALHSVQVRVQRGMVALYGRVPNFHLRQVAQRAALSVPGVRSLVDELQVS